MKEVKIVFEGIDSFNRPIFKSEKGSRYGSTNILFTHGASEKEVLEKVTESDLLYFGNSFDCEPMGDFPPKLKIIKEKISEMEDNL